MFIGLATDFCILRLRFPSCVAVESAFPPQSVKPLPFGALVFVCLFAPDFVNFQPKKALASGNLKHVYAFLNVRWVYDKPFHETFARAGFKLRAPLC